MTNTEWLILDALNIASTIHRDKLGFGATAAQIAEVIANDERLAADYTERLRDLNARQIGAHLAIMRGIRPGIVDRTGLRPPLVERVRPGSPRVRMSAWALTVVTA